MKNRVLDLDSVSCIIISLRTMIIYMLLARLRHIYGPCWLDIVVSNSGTVTKLVSWVDSLTLTTVRRLAFHVVMLMTLWVICNLRNKKVIDFQTYHKDSFLIELFHNLFRGLLKITNLKLVRFHGYKAQCWLSHGNCLFFFDSRFLLTYKIQAFKKISKNGRTLD